VLWLLDLRIGSPLPASPDGVAELLAARYEKDGYTAATVAATWDETAGRLTLAVDEGRIDAVEFENLPARHVERFQRDLGVRPGDVFNERELSRAVDGLLARAAGALVLQGRGIDLVDREGRRVLVIPLERKRGSFHLGLSSESREDFFSPVDGFTPGVSLRVVRYDAETFNHTYLTGYVSYKFSREDPGYSLGVEQPLLGRQLFLGAELHDVTASDDLWRLTTTEQSIVAITFKNTFRDYYRRRGVQAYAAVRPHPDHELLASMRWDRHESLQNETDFSFFRGDHPFRPNQAINGGDLRALVFGYTFDSRGVGLESTEQTYAHHLADDLFRATWRQSAGVRVDWTSEIAGHGLGGAYEYDRHILNARTSLPLSPRQTVAARAIVGFSGGRLPVERTFGIGGIGTVHGYAFKEALGEELTLFNLEYRLDLLGRWQSTASGLLRALVFYDAGRIREPIGGSRTDWLSGAGVGFQTGPIRIEFGFRTDDIPDSRQVLVRLSPTF
jgi:hypothetical protein